MKFIYPKPKTIGTFDSRNPNKNTIPDYKWLNDQIGYVREMGDMISYGHAHGYMHRIPMPSDRLKEEISLMNRLEIALENALQKIKAKNEQFKDECKLAELLENPIECQKLIEKWEKTND